MALPDNVVDIGKGQPIRGLAEQGGPPHDGGMEARLAHLESSVKYIERDVAELRVDSKALRDQVHAIRTTDFRIFFGALIAVALGLAGLMAKGFDWI